MACSKCPSQNIKQHHVITSTTSNARREKVTPLIIDKEKEPKTAPTHHMKTKTIRGS